MLEKEKEAKVETINFDNFPRTIKAYRNLLDIEGLSFTLRKTSKHEIERQIEANQLQPRSVAEIEEEVARNRNIATTEVESAAEIPNTDGLTASAALTVHRNYSSVESYRLAKLKV